MNRESWDLIKNSKMFNVDVYRRGLVASTSRSLNGIIMLQMG
jgi:hypothetical protein